ncbi:SGNH/GDSL hydrolase family protein [Nostocoides sp. F2B08]|uniref:SGNH/GDSL hydrolase family protein n=1 Tax=Nostocoides sp. F2B08 TaxID=2653936 RepID=UPI001263C25A|nr:SGNH/GDSL hydrolase family protein [Tetrasphaera sp. F2B08]KAB7745605.1 SGNH/GDSL hydrolase family protein [Tetrasphaera sp. F2B08]
MRTAYGRIRGAAPGRLWWLGLPVVPVQGYRLARSIPRFPDADGVTGQVGEGERRMKVVTLGDSVTAGYAVGHHRSSVAGQLAVRLAERYDATVMWEACARTGATAGLALELVSQEALAEADLVFVSIGVNDLKNLHSTTRFRREVSTLFDAILEAAPRARVCLLGIPPLDHFPAFPRPLADALGWRGRVFDAIGAEAVRARERMFRIETTEPLRAEMFAEDGFHPSPVLHAAFADAVMAGFETAESATEG